MSSYWEWTIVVSLFALVVLVAIGYYEIEARKYRNAEGNKGMGKFRDGRGSWTK